MVCSYLDRVGFLWGHKIPLPNKGAAASSDGRKTIAHGVGGADKRKGGRLAYTGGSASGGAAFFVAGRAFLAETGNTKHAFDFALASQPEWRGRSQPAILYNSAMRISQSARQSLR